MQIIRNPGRNEWAQVLARPAFDASALEATVQAVMDEVKRNGDAALRQYTRQFDKVEVAELAVEEALIQNSAAAVPEDLQAAIKQAAANIRTFHRAQLSAVDIIETMPGVRCWRKSVGIQKVGLYIPGGTAPLFSTVLMLAIPAVLAGCKEIVLCTPPSPEHAGLIHPAILFAAQTAGVNKIFRVGGVQAIAAMTYGTESVPSVYKIFGPGNQYVTCAKQLAQKSGMAIDMPAGPSEVAVYADASANAGYVAADLLSQAEHGADSQVVLVTTSESFLKQVQLAIHDQLVILPRKEIAAKALQHSKLIWMENESEAIDLLNTYAAEHLILSCADAATVSEKIVNAGSVFLGNYSPESVGDYASGTNHTLPTNGYAKAHSGVSVDSFVKKITFQELTRAGLQSLAHTVEVMAEAEGLHAHKNAVTIRTKRP